MNYYAIYAGHGGSDPGAVSGSMKEKDYTLAVANKLAELLRGDGHRVLQNRTTDTGRSITNDANKANAAGVDCVVEVHMNSNAGAPGTGTEVLYYSTGTSKTLAENIHKRIVAATGYANRGAKQRTDLGILKQTKMPAALVEMAFINNNSDMAKFDIDVMARAIRQGIYDTYGGTATDDPNSDNTNTQEAEDMTAEEVKVIVDQGISDYFANLENKPVSDYAKDYMAEAKSNGVTDGTAPGVYATREQVITILGRLGILGLNGSREASEWASEMWDEMTSEGIFDGTSPGAAITREQVAAVISRVLDKLTAE